MSDEKRVFSVVKSTDGDERFMVLNEKPSFTVNLEGKLVLVFEGKSIHSDHDVLEEAIDAIKKIGSQQINPRPTPKKKLA